MSNSILSEEFEPRKSQVAASAEELRQLGASIAALHVEMVQRITREESPGGFFSFITTAAPRYVTFIDSLRSEHQRLLGALTALRAKIARAAPEQWDSLLAETDAILVSIEDHEELEREVLRDAIEG